MVSEMTAMCNRFILMHQGRIINEGPAKDILRQYETDILRLPGAPHAIA